MTRPPSHPPGAPDHDEVLDELGDDAIVAQQAAVHALQPRAQVDMEARTIVVANEMPEVDPSEVMETRQLPQYTATGEPTTAAARRAASRAPTMVLRRVPSVPPPKRRNWMVIGIWVAAGVVAFGFGGVLAALTARGSDSAASATAAAIPAPPPRTAAPERATPAPAPPKPEPTQTEPEAITASDLPVEQGPTRAKPRPKAGSTAAPRATATATKVAPGKTEIPEGI